MLTIDGFCDSTPNGHRPQSASPRCRSQLQEERRQQRIATNDFWQASRDAKQNNAHARAVEAKLFARRSAAITRAKVPPDTAAPPPSAVSDSLIAGFVLKGQSARREERNADELSRGTRHLAGKDNNQESTLCFKDVISKRTFPHHPACQAHTSLGATSVGGCVGASADETSSSSDATLHRGLHRGGFMRPELPESSKRHRPLTGTIGRVVNVPHTAEPPIVPLHKMYVMRPEVTACDSYKVPVYSSFTPNHKFDPMLDAALKPYHRRMQKRKEDAMQRLRRRHVVHAAAVDEYNLALARRLTTREMLAVPRVTDTDMAAALEAQTTVDAVQATPRSRYENAAPTPAKRDDVSAARHSSVTAGHEAAPSHTAAAPAQHSRGRSPPGAAGSAATTQLQQQPHRPSTVAGRASIVAAEGSAAIAAPAPPKRPQTARTRSSGLTFSFSAVASAPAAPATMSTSALGVAELERVEAIFSQSVSRPSSARRPMCSSVMAIELGVARQDAPIRARSASIGSSAALRTATTACTSAASADGGLTPSEQLSH